MAQGLPALIQVGFGRETMKQKTTDSSPAGPSKRNRWGQIGLVLSWVGLLSIALIDPVRLEFVRYMTLCSFGGLLVSAVGLCFRPRKLARWGASLGAIGTMFLPTIFLPLLAR